MKDVCPWERDTVVWNGADEDLCAPYPVVRVKVKTTRLIPAVSQRRVSFIPHWEDWSHILDMLKDTVSKIHRATSEKKTLSFPFVTESDNVTCVMLCAVTQSEGLCCTKGHTQWGASYIGSSPPWPFPQSAVAATWLHRDNCIFVLCFVGFVISRTIYKYIF